MSVTIQLTEKQRTKAIFMSGEDGDQFEYFGGLPLLLEMETVKIKVIKEVKVVKEARGTRKTKKIVRLNPLYLTNVRKNIGLQQEE